MAEYTEQQLSDILNTKVQLIIELDILCFSIDTISEFGNGGIAFRLENEVFNKAKGKLSGEDVTIELTVNDVIQVVNILRQREEDYYADNNNELKIALTNTVMANAGMPAAGYLRDHFNLLSENRAEYKKRRVMKIKRKYNLPIDTPIIITDNS